jgi:small GTP-binding protein
MTPPTFSSSQQKVVFLGETRVGKTSIIACQIRGSGLHQPPSTIGCLYATTTVRVGSRTVSLQLWDTAGQEVYRSLVPIYVRGARVVVLVFDLTEPASLDALSEWIDVAHTSLMGGTPMILVANKADLTDGILISDDSIDRFAAAHNLSVVRASAMTGIGVAALFTAIAEIVLSLPVSLELREYVEAADADNDRCC